MRRFKTALLGMALTILTGCAYGHYLGLHGPSVKNFPDIHQDVTEDAACRECHAPTGDSTGPPTSHPNFTGCLKCHNGPPS